MQFDPTQDSPNRLSESLRLAVRAKDGDKDAYDQLYVRYFDRVLRIVNIKMGRALRGRINSEDIVQETFMAALTALPNFDIHEEASLIHWLSTIAMNRIRDLADYYNSEMRDARREVSIEIHVSGATPDSLQMNLASDSTQPAEKLSKKETLALVENAISQLREDYREVIVLRDYVGGSWKWIAAQMKKESEDAARMLHSRARMDLLRIIDGGNSGRADH